MRRSRRESAESVSDAVSWRLSTRLRLIAEAARDAGFSAAMALMWQGVRRRLGFAPVAQPVFGEDRLVAWLDAAVASDKSCPEALPSFISLVRQSVAAAAPRISVVIPCYNYGAYVEDAVASLETQVLRPIEIVLVDDGSTDAKTVETCRRLGETGRVDLRRQDNRGLSAARNAGAAATRGDFLLFLDADDTLDPLALAVLWYALSRNPETAYAYPYQQFFGDMDFVVASQGFNGYDLLFANHPCVTGLIRRQAFLDSGGYRPEMRYGFEDWEHWLALMKRGHIGMAVPMPLFRHRKHGVTMTQTAHERHRYLIERLVELHPDLYRPEAISARKRVWRPSVSILVAHSGPDDTLSRPSHSGLADVEWIEVAGDWHAAASKARGEFVIAVDAVSDVADVPLESMVLAGLMRPTERIIPAGAPRGRRPSAALVRREIFLDVGRPGSTPPRTMAEWLRAAARSRGTAPRRPGSTTLLSENGFQLDGPLRQAAVAWRRERAAPTQYHRYRRSLAPDLFSPRTWDPAVAPRVLILADRWQVSVETAAARWARAGYAPIAVVSTRPVARADSAWEIFWLSGWCRTAAERRKVLRYLVISRAVTVIQMDETSSFAPLVTVIAAGLPYLAVRTADARPAPAISEDLFDAKRRAAVLSVMGEPIF